MKLGSISFENHFVNSLPGDHANDKTSREVLNAVYSHVAPTPVRSPQLLAWSEDLARDFGLERPDLEETRLLGGNLVLPNMRPYALCYGGHQFGQWAGQLGDGRAMTLGEIKSFKGERWEMQLKGAGPTPYSRRSDGRAVLRSSVREFLCSEAMHHLGIATTRALSLVGTGDEVVRDMFYDGNAKAEPGAIVCRMAPSFLRFGNFEIFTARGDTSNLKKLADHVIENYFPELGAPGEPVYLKWFEEICRRTAVMIVNWMRVGFVHGVMNTDNMSILGLTIDYGPYGWLESYDPGWTPNTTDAAGRRYCYGRQPSIALWNLSQLAGALSPLMADPQVLGQGLDIFESVYEEEFLEMSAQKLGLKELSTVEEVALLTDLDRILRASDVDMTLFYRNLAHVNMSQAAEKNVQAIHPLIPAFYSSTKMNEATPHLMTWLQDYSHQVLKDQFETDERQTLMRRVNPKYVLRNYLAHQVIEAAEQGQPEKIEELLSVLRHPYDEQPENEHFAARRPDWALNKAGCSALSCSS